MKRHECWVCLDGSLENDIARAKAHDLHYCLPMSTANPNSKILTWNDCLHIIQNAEIIICHLKEYIDFKNKEAN